MFLETGAAFDSRLFTIARTIVRLVEEDAKPNADRLREYGEAGRASLEQTLYSPAPIYPEFEEAKLAHSLAFWRRTMGEPDPTLAGVLAGRTPEQAASELVRGSRLADVALRKALVEGRPSRGRGLGRPHDPAGPRRRSPRPAPSARSWTTRSTASRQPSTP